LQLSDEALQKCSHLLEEQWCVLVATLLRHFFSHAKQNATRFTQASELREVDPSALAHLLPRKLGNAVAAYFAGQDTVENRSELVCPPLPSNSYHVLFCVLG
jgi:hypothetical protein